MPPGVQDRATNERSDRVNPREHYSTVLDVEQPPFRIEEEFKNKIPPIGEDEFSRLRENIISAGEVYEPLVVWDGILVDGHNRWNVIQEFPEVKWRVRYIDCADKWAAFEWMYKNQLGRRNLTDEQRAYMIGKMYEARKNSKGGDRRSDEFSKDQNDPLKPKSTAEAIGREVGVAEPSVKRWEKFAKGVDALREVSPDAADKVLNGKSDLTKANVQAIAKMEPDEVQKTANEILNPPTKEERQKQRKVEVSNEDAVRVFSSGEAYNLDNLVDEVIENGEDCVDAIRTHIETRITLFDKASGRIAEAIDHIIESFSELRKEIVNKWN